MTDWLLAALLLALLVWLMAPQQLPVSLYKLSLVSMAAVAGYWIDHSLFPYARPDEFLPEASAEDPPPEEIMCNGSDDVCQLEAVADSQPLLMASAMLRRAIIVAATMLAVGLGA
ncbi:MAG: putative holin [Desulfovibrionaceae bacterium]|nr:putative holin [Desulfovibrionaceae bacterium]